MKGKKIHSAWSQRGNILIRKSEGDQPKQIRNHQELSIFGYNTDEIEDYSTLGTDVDSDEEDQP